MEKYLLGKINITNFKVGFLGVCLVVMVGGGRGVCFSKNGKNFENISLWNFRSDIWPFSSFLSNRRLRVILDGRSSQKYPVKAGVPQGFILGPTLSYYTLMSFLISVILLSSMLMILLSILIL